MGVSALFFCQLPPQALTRQLPQGGALRHCRKAYRHREKPSPWGRWHGAAVTEGVLLAFPFQGKLAEEN